ncbi:MAG: ABC transporter substrate-binding protein [Bryobacteraceae bacterium]
MTRSTRRAFVGGLVGTGLRADRPRYGGTLAVAAGFPILALTADPLVFEDGSGRARPGLAREWSAGAGFREWRFDLRGGVPTHDGVALTAEVAAEALGKVLRGYRWSGSGNRIVAASERSSPALPAELAHAAAGIPGTGPFRTETYKPGKLARVTAFEEYWNSRPYLDAVELRFAGAGAAVSEIAPGDIRRETQRGHRIHATPPNDLVALVFDRTHPSARRESIRRGLVAAIDRTPIANVILQKQGEAAGGILPGGVSGYGFLFSRERDLAGARRMLASAGEALPLGYDPAVAILKPIADRIALNAREAGLTIRTVDRAPAAVWLRRVAGLHTDPHLALAHYARGLELAEPAPAESLEELYLRERTLLAGGWVAPLFHVSRVYSVAPEVRNWPGAGLPEWRFEDTWLNRR